MAPHSPRAAKGLGREELEELYSKYAPVVHRRARLLLGRDADAWDVVHEVFEKMLKNATSFRSEAQPLTWVYRITTNACFNQLRSRKVREPLLAVVPEESASPLEDFEVRQLLERWLRHLEPREQEIACLLYIDGLTQDQVGDVLGLSRKTISRAVAELRDKAARLGALPEGEVGHG